MKLGILLAFRFLTKNKILRVNQCIPGHVISQHIYKIGHISAIFKDRDFWFGPKNSIKLYAEHFTIFGVIKGISGHMTGD